MPNTRTKPKASRWYDLTPSEKVEYKREICASSMACEAIRQELVRVQNLPNCSGVGVNMFTPAVEKAKALEFLAWQYDQAWNVHDRILDRHV